MKASKTLGTPENWQDFESLCKKLWGEIWKCPEIKKNGRAGQIQNGVDIYGIPSNDDEYYGIQCKGKDEYKHKQLTAKEIDKEIKKAKSFDPKLKKLYFATTAVKDTKIEEKIRLKNIEHKENKLFEVHLFSWEDIVDLIEENPETYDYYVNSINFKSSHSVAVTFSDDTTELTIVPKFRRRIPVVGQDPFANHNKALKAVTLASLLGKSKTNYSVCLFYLRIRNTGDAPLEEYKVSLKFEGEIIDLPDTNEPTKIRLIDRHDKRSTTTDIDSLTGEIVPEKNILVGDDTFISDGIFLKPSPKESKIVIKWKLISKSFKQEGDLLINVKPDIETVNKYITEKDPSKITEEIEDYFE